MKIQQDITQENAPVFVRFYLFLRDRDAKIIELFFWALNMYFLILILTPPYEVSMARTIVRALFQASTVTVNIFALLYNHKRTRMISAVTNTAIMTLIAVSLVYMSNVHAGTYVLLAFLAAFACWKIQIKQN